jgi:hypothetical protein
MLMVARDDRLSGRRHGTVYCLIFGFAIGWIPSPWGVLDVKGIRAGRGEHGSSKIQCWDFMSFCRKLGKAHAAGAVSHERTAAATRQSLVQAVVTWMAV